MVLGGAASGSPRGAGLGGRDRMSTLSHLMEFEGDTGQLAFLSRPSLGFLFYVVDAAVPAVSPWGQVHRAAWGRA